MVNARSEDTRALQSRLRLNGSQGTFQLAPWIAEHLGLDARSRLLDVGCGSGEMLLDFTGPIGPAGLRSAIDVSESSLAATAAEAKLRGISVELHALDMDRLCNPEVLPQLSELTHITSVYALYYSSSPVELLGALSRRLTRNGALILVGPAEGNNSEWFDFLANHQIPVPAPVRAVSDHFRSLIRSIGRDCFAYVDETAASNHITVPDALQLNEYWRANIYHRDDCDEQFQAAASSWFAAESTFRITKRISLIRLCQPL